VRRTALLRVEAAVALRVCGLPEAGAVLRAAAPTGTRRPVPHPASTKPAAREWGDALDLSSK